MSIAALEQALTFISRTDLIATARQQALPAGVTELLKISSGDNECLLAAQESSRHSQEDVRHAAEFYVQQILFAPDSDHYRILGVDPDDAEAKIKLHYRLLVRWLHPDKNSSDWEVVFSERINRAWHALRTPERRREYDEQLSTSAPLSKELTLNREIKPAQWRENKSDARFLTARTIKRLPIAVFSMLGLGALLALWWFSQMQPTLQPQPIAAIENEQALVQKIPSENLQVNLQPLPEESTSANPANQLQTEQINEVPAVVETHPLVAIQKTPNPMPVVEAKPVANVLAVQQKPIKAEPPKLQASVADLSATPVDTKQKGKRGLRNRTNNVAASSDDVRNGEALAATTNSVVSTKRPNAQKDTNSDALVAQFLQRFSRVYEDGDYFALHNLFTRDLAILGAPPQRNVLRSYRQLFETSETREIAITHVTWLNSDEHIVVIASYQAQVLPRGKTQTQSSRGDIRLDLRMENGQLKIIGLQSDSKNG